MPFLVARPATLEVHPAIAPVHLTIMSRAWPGANGRWPHDSATSSWTGAWKNWRWEDGGWQGREWSVQSDEGDADRSVAWTPGLEWRSTEPKQAPVAAAVPAPAPTSARTQVTAQAPVAEAACAPLCTGARTQVTAQVRRRLPRAVELACTPVAAVPLMHRQSSPRQRCRPTQNAMRRHHGPPRLWCHVHLQQLPDEFCFVQQFIGKRGVHTSQVFEDTGAKVRVRGQGSGHLEVESAREACVPLMISISAHGDDEDAFLRAVAAVIERLVELHVDYGDYCMKHASAPRYEHIWRIREAAARAQCLLLDRFPAYALDFGGRRRRNNKDVRVPAQMAQPSSPLTTPALLTGSHMPGNAAPGAAAAPPGLFMHYEWSPSQVAWPACYDPFNPSGFPVCSVQYSHAVWPGAPGTSVQWHCAR